MKQIKAWVIGLALGWIGSYFNAGLAWCMFLTGFLGTFVWLKGKS